jgi:hypothetical protein
LRILKSLVAAASVSAIALVVVFRLVAMKVGTEGDASYAAVVMSWCAALLAFPVAFLVSLVCLSRRNQDGDDRSARPPNGSGHGDAG